MTKEGQQALIFAGVMADYALRLVGGRGLNGTVPPAHPDQISEYSKLLRHAAETYNQHIMEMHAEAKRQEGRA
jgi:hypothetical protein